MVIFTVLTGISIDGSVFAADILSVHINDFVHKPVVTKMQTDTASTTRRITIIKHTKRKYKKISIDATSTIIQFDNHKDREKNDGRGGTPNSDEIKKP